MGKTITINQEELDMISESLDFFRNSVEIDNRKPGLINVSVTVRAMTSGKLTAAIEAENRRKTLESLTEKLEDSEQGDAIEII